MCSIVAQITPRTEKSQLLSKTTFHFPSFAKGSQGNGGSFTFQNNGGGYYTASYFEQDQLTYNASTNEYLVTKPDGSQELFSGTGQLLAKMNPFGMAMNFTYTGSGVLSSAVIGDTVGYYYTFDASYRQTGVVLRVGGSTSDYNVRQVLYAYDSSGNMVQVQLQGLDPTGAGWVTLKYAYFRYYTGTSLLKYAVEDDAYRQLCAANSQPLSTSLTWLESTSATDAIVAGYADQFYSYDSYGRVVAAATNGGKYGYSLSYSQSAVVSNNPNAWATKTVVTAPDGTIRTYYYNNAASLMLQMVTDTSGNVWYPICWQFDSNQRIVVSASSAVVWYVNESNPSLFTLASGRGPIEYYSYDGNGNKIQEALQSYGAEIVTKKTWSYGVRTVGGISIYPLASETVYWNTAGSPTSTSTTSYDYAWFEDFYGNPTFQVGTKTTILPVVPTSQNGPGGTTGASRTENYGIYGLLNSTVDEVGTVTNYNYDWSTSPWSGGAGGWGLTSKTEDPTGLNLTTTYEVDALGRTVLELGPVHTISLGGVATSIQRAQWTNYQDTYLQTQTINGYISGGVSTVESPIMVKVSYSNGAVAGTRMEQEYAATWTSSALPTPSTTFAQSSYCRWSTKIMSSQNELSSSELYYLIPSSGYGSQGVNFAQTSYGYDSAGRENQVTSPGGTITQKSFNALGWLLQTSVGTTLSNLLPTETLTYDNGLAGGNGNITTRTVAVDSNSANNRVTYYTYDLWDRVTQTQAFDGTRNIFRVMSYDNQNNVLAVYEFYNYVFNSTLQNQSTTSFDVLGRVYQTQRFGVTLGTGVVGSALTANTYYDPTGRVVREAPAGESDFSAMVYDSIGRLVTRYRAYGGTLNASSPGDVSTATVVEQWTSTYDAASNLISAINAQRFDNAIGTGALQNPTTQPEARVYNTANYPDPLGRTVASANYGTNGAAAWTRPSTIPASSATVLVTGFVFDNTGAQVQVIDPLGGVTQFGYDAAGRRTQVIENYGSGASLNKTTNFSYNDDGYLIKLTAINAVTGNQVTQWVYGVSTAGSSAINSNDFLFIKILPDSTQIGYHVNRQGQVIWMEDQLATGHVYSYDLFGRLTQDTIAQFGTGVDTTVKQIVRTYESRGMLQSISSYSGTTVLNEAQMVYDSFSQLIADYQAHSGAVNTLATPSVQYANANGSSNTIRLTTLTYPNGRQLTYDYGASGGINDCLNRVASLDQSGGSLASYTYLGSSTIVTANYPQPAVELTYISQTGGTGDAGDKYTGLDRFGRVVDNQWVQGSSAIDRIDYGYDQASNRVFRQNLVVSGEDEYYSYDGLYQLNTLERGTLNSGKTGITGTPNWEEEFSLDPSGNWTNYETLVSGSTTLNQSRTQSTSNEILTLSGTSVLPGYNPVGNMITTTVPGNWSSGYSLIWDAWNRLVQVMSGGTVVATYGYDGLNRRITQVTASQSNDYYYSKDWQIVQENSVSSGSGAFSGGSLSGSSSSSSNASITQYVWGQRGVDDVVLRDVTTNFTQRLYALRDVMHVTAITSSTGVVLESYDYDAYGNTRVNGSSSNVSFYNWNVRYCSYLFDQESGFYQVRNRYLHPGLGRWLSRDPLPNAELSQGNNLYWYVGNNPGNNTDPLGLLRDCDSEHIACFRICLASCPPWPCKKGDSCHYRYCESTCLAEYMECEAENALQIALQWCSNHPVECVLIGIAAIEAAELAALLAAAAIAV